jgi:hypothetical protein
MRPLVALVVDPGTVSNLRIRLVNFDKDSDIMIQTLFFLSRP